MEEMDLARKEKEEEGQVCAKSIHTVPDSEVAERPVRRQFSTAYKLRILEEADGCIKPGELGALLRREGLYYSSLRRWRKQRMEGTLAGLKPRKRGRRGNDAKAMEIKRLERENAELRRELKRARTVIEVQKKLSDVLGITLPKADPEEKS